MIGLTELNLIVDYEIVELKATDDGRIFIEIKYYCPRCEKEHVKGWGFGKEFFDQDELYKKVISRSIETHFKISESDVLHSALNEKKQVKFESVGVPLPEELYNVLSVKNKKISEFVGNEF